jgi:[acyl-carrier-protein] S-malonyltransferase
MAKTAFVFPGQGSQSPGMGYDLYQQFAAARRVFDQADEALGFRLSRLCFEGPEEELRLTINAQPAIMTVSVACLAAMDDLGTAPVPAPAYVAGHSLGEYTALVASKALGFPSTLRLVRERGRLMHEAGQLVPSGMAAVLGLDESTLEEVCRGARRALPLNVSAGFHSAVMRPAQEGIARALNGVSLHDPATPIIANVTAQPLTTAEQLRSELVCQMCSCVHWQRSIQYMVEDGVDTFVEIGPGQVLAGLIRRIADGARVVSVRDAGSVCGAA